MGIRIANSSLAVFIFGLMAAACRFLFNTGTEVLCPVFDDALLSWWKSFSLQPVIAVL
jgi:hypothetical protein